MIVVAFNKFLIVVAFQKGRHYIIGSLSLLIWSTQIISWSQQQKLGFPSIKFRHLQLKLDACIKNNSINENETFAFMNGKCLHS